MASSTLFLNTPSPSAFSARTNLRDGHRLRRRSYRTAACGRRGGGSSSSSIGGGEYDLYELLGVESSSDQTQIKKAYRALQKRCHPDIAGEPGHDMAIVLNEVYSLLSDPVARSAYDKEQAKLSQFQGYSGKPLYSTWFGPESEERAVFVDELKCVGCLKCALFASRTFAIESAYGRARVVAQWADPEDKILDAIDTCPVDCISIVERSDLAALEFLMSKQPRGSVRMTGGNTGGERVSNIFADVSKFQSKFDAMKDQASRNEKESDDLRGESILSAIRGIQSISNWWYWQAPAPSVEPRAEGSLIVLPNSKPNVPNTERIKEVAAKFRAAKTEAAATASVIVDEEYWSPTRNLPSPSSSSNTKPPSSLEPSPRAVAEDTEEVAGREANDRRGPVSLVAPMVMAVVSAVITGSRGGELMVGGGVREHMGGAAALEVVNSFELQVVLAGVTWFLIGMAISGLIGTLGNKDMYRK